MPYRWRTDTRRAMVMGGMMPKPSSRGRQTHSPASPCRAVYLEEEEGPRGVWAWPAARLFSSREICSQDRRWRTAARTASEAGGTQPRQSSRGRQGHTPAARLTWQSHSPLLHWPCCPGNALRGCTAWTLAEPPPASTIAEPPPAWTSILHWAGGLQVSRAPGLQVSRSPGLQVSRSPGLQGSRAPGLQGSLWSRQSDVGYA
ncbi:hypothetical protein CRUP_035850 [Coryphaenoides rupestris]|nr:hypothetical protein CRUP_035850 [Coryphaenoides rupestris]